MIDSCEKRIDYPAGHSSGHVFLASSKLEVMPIYLVKQACGNDKRASVYLNFCEGIVATLFYFNYALIKHFILIQYNPFLHQF